MEAGSGRLVYDKERRTLVGKQVIQDHPLSKFGYRRPPPWLWRRSQRAFVVVMAIKDIWLIARGRLTLHRAWQAGYDAHAMDEFARRANGGK